MCEIHYLEYGFAYNPCLDCLLIRSAAYEQLVAEQLPSLASARDKEAEINNFTRCGASLRHDRWLATRRRNLKRRAETAGACVNIWRTIWQWHDVQWFDYSHYLQRGLPLPEDRLANYAPQQLSDTEIEVAIELLLAEIAVAN